MVQAAIHKLGQYAYTTLMTGCDFLEQAGEQLPEISSKAREALVDGFIFGKSTWVSRSVENWTNTHLPPHAAKVVSTLIMAAPFIAAPFVLPFPAYFACSAICGIGRLVTVIQRIRETETTDLLEMRNISRPITTDLSHGQSIAWLTKGMIMTAKGIVTMNPLDILEGTACGLVSAVTLLESGFIQEAREATGEVVEIAQRKARSIIQEASRNETVQQIQQVGHTIFNHCQDFQRNLAVRINQVRANAI